MVYIHLADGFEEIEAIATLDILRRAHIPAQTVSVMREIAVKGAHGIIITADILFDDADYAACDMIVLPGGLPGATNLAAHEGLCERLKEFAAKGKYLAAICAAPNVLGGLGILDGRKATCYPGCEPGMGAANIVQDAALPTVVDANIITSRGPGTAVPFALAIIETLKGTESRRRTAEDLLWIVKFPLA